MRRSPFRRRAAVAAALVAVLGTGGLHASPAAAEHQRSEACAFFDAFALPPTTTSFSIALGSALQPGEVVTVSASDASDGNVLTLEIGTFGDREVLSATASGGALAATYEAAGGEDYLFVYTNGTDLQAQVLEMTCAGAPHPPPDADDDGVADGDDACPGTDLSNDVRPTHENRFGADASGAFVDGQGRPSGFTIVDTGGCSASQLIDRLGLGVGHRRFGISRGALLEAVATLGP